jgi:hypothetical protein
MHSNKLLRSPLNGTMILCNQMIHVFDLFLYRFVRGSPSVPSPQILGDQLQNFIEILVIQLAVI